MTQTMPDTWSMIGGVPTAATDGGWFETRDPTTGGALAGVPRCGARDVDAAVRAARAAQPAWAALGEYSAPRTTTVRVGAA